MSFTNLHCTCTCIDVPLHKNWNTLLNPLQINFWWLCWNHQIWRYNILYTCSVKLLHAIMVFFFIKFFQFYIPRYMYKYLIWRFASAIIFLFKEISEAHAWHKGCPGDLRCVMTHSNAIDKGQGHINMACILRPCKG